MLRASVDEPLFPPPGFGYRSPSLLVAGVSISFYNHPPCVYSRDYDCEWCDFFFPQDCPLLRDPTALLDIESVFDAYREYLAEYLRHKSRLIAAVRCELEQHGRPLHCSVVADMVAGRHPEFSVTENQIKVLMSACPEQFECIGPGVYGIAQSSRS